MSISAYRDTDTDIAFDQDNTPLPLVNAPIFYRTETFSQEFQLLSNDSERFDWIVGLFYMDLDFDYQLVLNGLGLPTGRRRQAQPTASDVLRRVRAGHVCDRRCDQPDGGHSFHE